MRTPLLWNNLKNSSLDTSEYSIWRIWRWPEVLEEHGKQEMGFPMASQLLPHIHYPELNKELYLGKKAGFLCSNIKNNNSYYLFVIYWVPDTVCTSKHLTHIISCNPQTLLLLSPLYRKVKRDLKKLSNLLKVIQFVSCRAGSQTEADWLKTTVYVCMCVSMCTIAHPSLPMLCV